MICADTNCWIAYLSGDSGQDVEILDHAVINHAVVMAPVVLSELLSEPALEAQDELDLCAIRLMDVLPGYWERVGKLRAILLAKRKFEPWRDSGTSPWLRPIRRRRRDTARHEIREANRSGGGAWPPRDGIWCNRFNV